MSTLGSEVETPKGLDVLDVYHGDDMPEGGFYVISVDNSNIAQSLVRLHPHPTEQETYLVTNLNTREDRRRQGLGSAVLYAAEKSAVRLGAKRFILFSDIEHAPFYIKRGYLPDGKGIEKENNIYPKLIKEVKD